MLTTEMMINIDGKNINLTGLNKFNLILGRTGCGKSRLLKKIYEQLKSESKVVRYVQAERGNRAIYDELSYDYDTMMRYQEETTFRSETYEKFQTSIKKRLNHKQSLKDDYVLPINKILEFVEVEIDSNATIRVYKKGTETQIKEFEISSGENELISLWVEILRFFELEGSNSGDTFLLLDEIDTHLHPDAQFKLANFIYEWSTTLYPNRTLQVIIVTHSTAILSALSDKENTSVCFMKSDSDLEFVALLDTQEASATNIVKLMLPIFGAHPLTQVFNEKPLLLVEGEDDERIWQQAVRSSEGKLKIFPREVGGTSKISPLEDKLDQVLASIYDNPIVFTLRDRDDIKLDADVPLSNQGSVIRLRLYCRAAENLLITDEVIRTIGSKYKINKKNIDLDWSDISTEINNWLETQKISEKKHPKYKHMESFISTENNRKLADIKQIRNLLLQIIEDAINRKKASILQRELTDEECVTVNTDWEILVGQTIGLLVKDKLKPILTENSILQYLGAEIVSNLLKMQFIKFLLNSESTPLISIAENITERAPIYLKQTIRFTVWEREDSQVTSARRHVPSI